MEEVSLTHVPETQLQFVLSSPEPEPDPLQPVAEPSVNNTRVKPAKCVLEACKQDELPNVLPDILKAAFPSGHSKGQSYGVGVKVCEYKCCFATRHKCTYRCVRSITLSYSFVNHDILL